MKKMFVFVLAVLVLASLGLVACGGTEETTTTTEAAVETTTTEAEVLIPWDEALDYLDTTGTVTGPVVLILDRSADFGKVLVHMGESQDNAAVAMFLVEDLDKFGGVDVLNALEGKTIKVTGEIYLNEFNRKAEIAVTDASQLEVVD